MPPRRDSDHLDDATCPHCGAEVRAGRLACAECGADAATGWQSSDEVDYQSVEIPDAWDEPPRAARPKWASALIVLTALVFALWAVLAAT